MSQELSLQELLEKASSFLGEKKNLEAIETVKKLLAIDPENDQGWLLLGIAYRRIGRLKSATQSFQKATELNSSMDEAWGLLAVSFLDRSQDNLAKECLLTSVRLNPSSKELKFYEQNLIRIYKKFGPLF